MSSHNSLSCFSTFSIELPFSFPSLLLPFSFPPSSLLLPFSFPSPSPYPSPSPFLWPLISFPPGGEWNYIHPWKCITPNPLRGNCIVHILRKGIKKNSSCKCLRKYIFTNGFILGLPFANLLRNFCGTKRKIFLYLWIIFARKKNTNLRIHLQKSFRSKLSCSAFAKLKFCSIPQLEFCAIPQFRKNQTVGDDVCVS